jgi:hypothetical protein
MVCVVDQRVLDGAYPLLQFAVSDRNNAVGAD